MKNFSYLFLAICLIVVPDFALAEKVPMNADDPTLSKICVMGDKRIPCFIVEHEGLYYLIIVDRDGDIAQEYLIVGEGDILLKYSKDKL